MKTVGNGWENTLTISVTAFFSQKREREPGKSDGKTNSIFRDIGNGTCRSGTRRLRSRIDNIKRDHIVSDAHAQISLSQLTHRHTPVQHTLHRDSHKHRHIL
jgi:hypothetical protein